MTVSIAHRKEENLEWWGKATINRAGLDHEAQKLVNAKATYQEAEAATGVPWFFIAVVHMRESDQNFNTQLAQGDPLHHVSIHVPAGRGPFATWKDGAIDALVHCPPHSASNKDWSIGGFLTQGELYNGLGYAMHGLRTGVPTPSPYVWAGTDVYHSGKYVRDGIYDAHFVDPQWGIAPLLMGMMKLDTSIQFNITPTPVAAEPAAPVADNRTWWQKLFG